LADAALTVEDKKIEENKEDDESRAKVQHKRLRERGELHREISFGTQREREERECLPPL